MSGRPSRRGFLVVIFDREARTFSVEGPIWSEKPCRDAVARTRLEGRDVGYIRYRDGSACEWRRSAAERFRRASKYRRVAMGAILGTDLRNPG